MRMVERARLGVGMVCLALVSSAAGSASAQEEPTPTDTAAARALGQEGVKLADAGNCQEAVDRLSRAEKIFHAPTTLGRLGECQVQLGKIVDGTENLNKVARETLAPSAPAAFVQAQERARRVLAEAKPKIAKLKIAVAGPSDVAWTVKVDGEPVPLANLNTNRPVDPGEHSVEATAPGYKPARAKVTLAEGGADSVALTLEIDKTAVKSDSAPVVAPSAEPAKGAPRNEPRYAEPEPPASKVPAYVAAGVGVVGIGVGTAFGLMAMSKKDDLDAACSAQKICAADQRDVIDTGKTYGVVSTVSLVVGGVGLAAAVYLYITASGTAGRSAALARPFFSVDRAGFVF